MCCIDELIYTTCLVFNSNSLDFNIDTQWQGLNSDTRSSWLVGVEVFSVDNVESSKVVHVSEEDIDLDSLVKTRTSSLQDGLDVLDTLFSSVRDGALNWLSFRSVWNLTRDVNKVLF